MVSALTRAAGPQHRQEPPEANLPHIDEPRPPLQIPHEQRLVVALAARMLLQAPIHMSRRRRPHEEAEEFVSGVRLDIPRPPHDAIPPVAHTNLEVEGVGGPHLRQPPVGVTEHSLLRRATTTEKAAYSHALKDVRDDVPTDCNSTRHEIPESHFAPGVGACRRHQVTGARSVPGARHLVDGRVGRHPDEDSLTVPNLAHSLLLPSQCRRKVTNGHVNATAFLDDAPVIHLFKCVESARCVRRHHHSSRN